MDLSTSSHLGSPRSKTHLKTLSTCSQKDMAKYWVTKISHTKKKHQNISFRLKLITNPPNFCSPASWVVFFSETKTRGDCVELFDIQLQFFSSDLGSRKSTIFFKKKNTNFQRSRKALEMDTGQKIFQKTKSCQGDQPTLIFLKNFETWPTNRHLSVKKIEMYQVI